MKRSLLFFSLSLMLTACGSSTSSKSSTSSSSTNTKLTYEFIEEINGSKCTTQKHTSPSVQVLCQVLGDEEANRGCAVEQRQQMQVANNCANVTPVATTSFFFGACEDITGAVHHIESLEAQCEALKSEKLNAGCAKKDRQEMVKAFKCK